MTTGVDGFADLTEILGGGGALARALPGFAPRAAQIEMAEAVAQALSRREVLVAEAGTGTGKTFAYLTPALLNGGRIVVSTATKHLQDQLFKKDLPTLAQALGVGRKTVLLKGRANYACWHRLLRAEAEALQRGQPDTPMLRRVSAWCAATATGDRAEFTDLPEDHRLWFRVTSTTDNCLGQECEHYANCFVVRARRAALDADVVVINHHVFCADLALKETGFGELLPKVDGIILDEAHQLPEIATRFFGESLSSRGLLDLFEDVIAETRADAPDMRELIELAERLPGDVLSLRRALGSDPHRAAWPPGRGAREVTDACGSLAAGLAALVEWLDEASTRSTGLQNCHRRAAIAQGLLATLDAPGENLVHWYETTGQGFHLHASPLEIAPVFRKYLDRLPVGWVFTSATLAVGEDFSHFTARLGIGEASTRRWDSPFDYAHHALLYLPGGLPNPDHAAYTQAVVTRVLPLIEANPGGTFVLFTSFRAMEIAASELEGRTVRRVLVQGSAPRHELLTLFREAGDAVLLGTSSFWEGVDVRGRALSCVVIDKLPFAAPGDPVLEARSAALRAQGRNPFIDYQVPQAVIALKQGAGRLIRDVEDRGLLVLCDPRVTSRSYGRYFLVSLPPMPVTRDGAEAEAFLCSL